MTKIDSSKMWELPFPKTEDFEVLAAEIAVQNVGRKNFAIVAYIPPECKSNPHSCANSSKILIYSFGHISETLQLFIPIFQKQN